MTNPFYPPAPDGVAWTGVIVPDGDWNVRDWVPHWMGDKYFAVHPTDACLLVGVRTGLTPHPDVLDSGHEKGAELEPLTPDKRSESHV